MPSIKLVANPEATTPATITVTNLNKEKFKISLVFYPNRVRSHVHSQSKNGKHDDSEIMHTIATIGSEPDEDDDDFDPVADIRRQTEDSLMEAAAAFCEMYESWDLTGPLENGDGNRIVDEGEMIPLEAEYVRWIPAWLRSEINTGVQEILFPSLKASRVGRRR